MSVKSLAPKSLKRVLPLIGVAAALMCAVPAQAGWVFDRYETLPNAHTYVNAGGPGTVTDSALPAAPDDQGRNSATVGAPMLWPLSVPVSQAPYGLKVFANAYTKSIGGEVWAHTEGTVYGVIRWVQSYPGDTLRPGTLSVDVSSSATCESLNAPPLNVPPLQVVADNGLGNPMQKIPYQQYGPQHFIYQSAGVRTYTYSVGGSGELRIPVTVKAWSRNIGNDGNGVTMKSKTHVSVQFTVKSFVASP